MHSTADTLTPLFGGDRRLNARSSRSKRLAIVATRAENLPVTDQWSALLADRDTRVIELDAPDGSAVPDTRD